MLTIEKKSLKVGKYVDSRHVDTLVRNYKQEKWIHSSQRLGKDDSLSVFYTVADLEGFIEKIKQHGADGVRFYFGAYPNDPSYQFPGQQTFVMVASKANKDLYISGTQGPEILAYNFGQVCPNYCPGGRTGGTSGDDDGWGGIGTTLIDKGDDGMVIV